MDLQLKGKIAVVTGGAAGIGFKSAEMLAEEGASVVIADIAEEKAAAAAEKLCENGCDVAGFGVDVSDKKSVDEMVSRTLERFGRLDIIVNNAGIGIFKGLEEEDLDEWHRILDINLSGVYYCSRAAFEQMKKQGGGRIITIGSLGGQIGGMKVTPGYVASKAGVMGLTKSYARHGAKYGIKANSVAPGLIVTDMSRGLYSPDLVPLGRLGQAEDVAKAVVFLASSMADYLTGVTLDVNGGILMR